MHFSETFCHKLTAKRRRVSAGNGEMHCLYTMTNPCAVHVTHTYKLAILEFDIPLRWMLRHKQKRFVALVPRNKKCGLFQINQEVDDYVEHVTGLNGNTDAGWSHRGCTLDTKRVPQSKGEYKMWK